MTIEVHHRRTLPRVWQQYNPGRRLPGLYAFRAWNRADHIHLFVDDTETRESALWLLLHELGHSITNQDPWLRQKLHSVPKPVDYLTNDLAHEAYPPEQAANDIANRLAVQLGIPRDLDRLWWRQRVRSRQKYGR